MCPSVGLCSRRFLRTVRARRSHVRALAWTSAAPCIGAIEIRTRTTLTLDLAARPKQMSWPRLETGEHIATIASARPLEDAFRLAVEELVQWMVADYGFTPPDAVMLLGQVAEARCTQLVNPKYTYIAKIAKRYLG
jgi:amidase